MNENTLVIDDKNMMVMKLLHYFITEKSYTPIILQGAENEIWLENLNEDYKIVRIVSAYIHNDEQYQFDVFKTRRIIKKIKSKTLSFNLNTLSIFLDLSSNVQLNPLKNLTSIRVDEDNDILQNEIIKTNFPDLPNKLTFTEKGMQLFVKITNDINAHNREDQKKAEAVFEPKKPVVTLFLIFLNLVCFLLPKLFGIDDWFLETFFTYGPLIRIGQYYRLLTGAFLHANLFHFFFNMYALYIIGSQLENFMGRVKYLIIYLFSCLSASLLSITFSGNGASIGASGAIFGLMGSLLYFGYHYRVYLGNVIRSQIIPLIMINLLFGFIMNGIDNAAHIGGLIGGLLISIAVGVKYKSSKFEQINGVIVTALFTAFLIYMAFVFAA